MAQQNVSQKDWLAGDSRTQPQALKLCDCVQESEGAERGGQNVGWVERGFSGSCVLARQEQR